jgi:hypothetical protein
MMNQIKGLKQYGYHWCYGAQIGGFVIENQLINMVIYSIQPARFMDNAREIEQTAHLIDPRFIFLNFGKTCGNK